MNPADQTLPQLVLHNGERFAKQDAIREKHLGIWQTYTWREYEEHVRRFALGLAALGFQRGDRLAVIGDNRPRLYWAMLAAQSLGGIALGVYQDSIASEMGFVLSHAEVRFILAEDVEQVDKLYEMRQEIPTVERVFFDDPRGLELREDDWLMPYEQVESQGAAFEAEHPGYLNAEIAKCKPDDVALMCYTSGTTGNPKGVMLSHRNIISVTWEIIKADDWKVTDEALSYLPIAWVGDYYTSVVGSLLSGMTVNCPEGPTTVRRDYREIGPTMGFAPPRNWENGLTYIQVRMEEAGWLKRWTFNFFMDVAKRAEIVRKQGGSLSPGLRVLNGLGDVLVRAPLRDLLGMRRLRYAYTGGAPLGPDVFDFFRALGINLKQVYGLTESAAVCIYQPNGEARPDTVGRPLDGVEVKIADNGEILLRGQMNFQGYYKNEEATREAFADEGWLKTGDAGFLDEGGHLKVVDRAKDVSKLQDGTLFAPQFLENKLKFSPYIKEAVTIGVERPFVGAMINIDLDAMENWAERHGVSYSGYRELAQHPDTYRLIQGEIRKINRNLSLDRELTGAQIRRFLVLYKELDPDDGEITRTRKLRRRVIGERYAELIEALFDGKEQIEVEVPVTYEDGRTAVLNATVQVWDVAAPAGEATAELEISA